MTIASQVLLVDICRPRQWPTLSMRQLTASGYPVYGANGVIGFSPEYTHASPTILIGCRGSCGTVHVTGGPAYVNGNAMALDDLDTLRADLRYLARYLEFRGFKDVATGTSQPQITGQGLAKVLVPLPPLPEQQRIAGIFDRADGIRRKRQETIALTEELLRATFLEMFGDPVTNPKRWPTKTIREIATVTTGNTPPRENPAYYGDSIEWIKSDNINTRHHLVTKAAEGLSAEGRAVGRVAPVDSTLITCIAGSRDCIGNAALTDREVAFNQQINALTANEDVDPYFLYVQVVLAKRLIQTASTNSMKGMVSKGRLEHVEFIVPPERLQRQLGDYFRTLLGLTKKASRFHEESEQLFGSLVQRAFRGEL